MNFATSTEVSRREFLLGATAGIAGVSLGLGFSSAASAGEGKKIPVGLELYSLRDQCKTDLPGMLVAVSKIGYKGVEFAGYHGHDAKELRKILDDNGLVACGTHSPIETVRGDKLKGTIEFNHILGNKFIIVPWLEAKTKEQWLDHAKAFNELSDQLKAEDQFIGYHSHKHDFKKFDEEYSWDIFCDHTKPAVIAQLDVANCADGGADPVAELKKYPGRTRSIHLKPYGAGPEAVIGEDKLDWKGIFACCETTAGTEWYVVEHETSKDPLGTVKRSFEALKNLGKA